jgi:hypothetical protein
MLNAKYIIAQNPTKWAANGYPESGRLRQLLVGQECKVCKGRCGRNTNYRICNLKDTAIVQQSFAGKVVPAAMGFNRDNWLTKFDNDNMEYSASCNLPQFAIFSEVYFPDGWNAYLDGKKADYVKADYVFKRTINSRRQAHN